METSAKQPSPRGEQTIKSSGRIALVVGATGGVGGETARALARQGWAIRALSRKGKPAGDTTGWEWVTGDSMDPSSIIRAAAGVSAIVHAVNPEGYKNWGQLVLPMIESTIAAARATGARILLPGTIYNYGPDAFPVLRDDSPQRATTHKGTIRIALEKRLETAARDGVPALIVRFGDFFGPNPGQSYFSQGVVKPGKPVTSVYRLGPKGVGHDWAYLPDCGETFARLMDRDTELPSFARFHFRGHYDADGTQFVAAIGRATGNPGLKASPFPWFAIWLGSFFTETMRELYAVRPLWQQPIELDNARLVAFLGEEPHTPLDQAMTATLQGMGCL